MFGILLATTLSGILFSKISLLFGLADFRVRYPLVVVCSYLVFFGCIKLWLSWIASVKETKSSVADWLDFPASLPGDAGGNIVPSFHGGGGQFSGGGASGSFDSPDTTLVETSLLPDATSAVGEGTSSGIADTVGEAAGAFGDDEGIFLIIALAVVVVTILVSTFLVIYAAPTILAEAAFEGVLAASLIKRTRAISDEAWVGSVFKATCKPFIFALGAAIFCGWILHHYFPQAVKLADII